MIIFSNLLRLHRKFVLMWSLVKKEQRTYFCDMIEFLLQHSFAYRAINNWSDFSRGFLHISRFFEKFLRTLKVLQPHNLAGLMTLVDCLFLCFINVSFLIHLFSSL